MSCRSETVGSTICCIIFFIVLIIFLGTYISPLSKINNFYETECNITTVTYPISYPTPSNTNNWRECDCGKHCMSWSPCISLYSDIKPDVVIFDSLMNQQSLYCTFHDYRCSDGENLQVIERYLRESVDTYNSYINTTQTCYINDDVNEIYLNIDINLPVMITLVVIMGLSIITICFCMLSYYRDKFNEAKTTKSNNV